MSFMAAKPTGPNLWAEIVTWAVPGEVLGHLDGPPQDLLQFRRTFRKHSVGEASGQHPAVIREYPVIRIQPAKK